MTSIQTLLQQGSQQLSNTSDTARIDTECLLQCVLRCDRVYLYTHPNQAIPESEKALFFSLIERRKKHEPIAYLTGRKAFWKSMFTVSPATLIPRPETELLIELALAQDNNTLDVLELGTGTGAIAISLQQEKPSWKITACDISNEALSIAKQNAKDLQIDTIHFIQSDWFSAFENQSFDLIISNPPYLDQHDPHLTNELLFEPPQALISTPHELSDIEKIINGAIHHLKPNAYLMLEHGLTQGKSIQALFAKAGFTHIQTQRDLGHRDRVTLGKKDL